MEFIVKLICLFWCSLFLYMLGGLFEVCAGNTFASLVVCGGIGLGVAGWLWALLH